MKRSKNKKEERKTDRLRHEAKIGGELPGRDVSEIEEIEQARIENRREADLDDKTPAGDTGPEDHNNNRQTNDPIGESNYQEMITDR